MGDEVKVSSAKVYTWVPGSRFSVYDATIIGSELESLIEVHNQALTAEDVVEAARAPTSAMHPIFGFGEDERLAHERRLELARGLLRSVRVRILTPKKKEVVVRLTVATPGAPDPNKKNYSTTEYALNDPEMRTEVLRQALRELIAFRRKYAELSELSIVFAAIDKMKKLQA